MHTKVDYKIRRCLFCREYFKPTRRDKKFCSRKCKTTNKKTPYRIHKGSICVACGFIPEDKCQLDVDHIDGNHKNNCVDNLQTLCANCHRIKTKKDQEKRSYLAPSPLSK